MSVFIATSNSGWRLGGHNIIRTSTGKLYAVGTDTGGVNDDWVRIYYGGTDGSAWAEKDAGNAPQAYTSASHDTAACAIDSLDIIHVVYKANAGPNHDKIFYVTFDTADGGAQDDAWNTPEAAIDHDRPADFETFDIAIDSNDIAHIVGLLEDANMGIGYNTFVYGNRIGGSWSDMVIDGAPNQEDCSGVGIAINDIDRPVIAWVNDTNTTVWAGLGDGNDPGSFTVKDVDTSVASGAKYLTGIGVDSGGDTWIAYRDGDGTIDIAKQSGNWTDAWTIVSDGDVGLTPCLAIDGTDVYVFYEDDNNDIVYNMYDGLWAGEVTLETGTFAVPRARWSYLNNPAYATYGIDYVFLDGNDLEYANLSLAVSTSYVQKIIMII